MARGPKKHLKRLAAPKHWMLSKLGGIFAPRPSSGPHKLRECLPLTLILRNRLKYALTRREVIMIVNRRFVKVDGKVRTDVNYPAGFMDVVSIDKAARTFRLLYDTTGRFALHKINDIESKYKLCKVTHKAIGAKAFCGRNPLRHGYEASIPYITTHDGRTIRYVDPLIKVNDTVKIDLETGKIVDFLKFDIGSKVMSIRGNNIGRVGVVTHVEYHPGSFDIVHVKDARGDSFVTRLSNVFAIGTSESLWISLPSGNGIKLGAIENRDRVIKIKSRN